MDEVKQRLKDTSDACIATYEAWRAKPNEAGAREALQEAVHELRKVGARVEIELAVSDRKTQNSDPIPIPSHRASRRPGGEDANAPQEHRPDDRGNQSGGNFARDRKPVQIRRPESDGNTQPANAAPAAASAPAAAAAAAPASEGEDVKTGGKRPLSLRRSAPDSE